MTPRSEWRYVVDPEYAEQVCSMRWGRSSAGYLAGGHGGGGKYVYMHRFVWELATGSAPIEGCVIDHINRIPWDNRIENLRMTTQSGNLHNIRPARACGLPTGVSLDRRYRRPYYARIKDNGRNVLLGRYDTPEEASAAYERARTKSISSEECRAKATERDRPTSSRGGSSEGNHHTDRVARGLIRFAKGK